MQYQMTPTHKAEAYLAATLIDQGMSDRIISRTTLLTPKAVRSLREDAERISREVGRTYAARIRVAGQVMHERDDRPPHTISELAQEVGEKDEDIIHEIVQAMEKSGWTLRISVPEKKLEGILNMMDWEGPQSKMMESLLQTEPTDEYNEEIRNILFGTASSLKTVRILLDTKDDSYSAHIQEAPKNPNWPSSKPIYIEFNDLIVRETETGVDTWYGVLVAGAPEPPEPRTILMPFRNGAKVHAIIFCMNQETGEYTDMDGNPTETHPIFQPIMEMVREVAAQISFPRTRLKEAPLNRNQRRRLERKSIPNPWLIPVPPVIT